MARSTILVLSLVCALALAQNCGCPDNECCSQYGYCGTTKDYCGTSCRENCNAGGGGNNNKNMGTIDLKVDRPGFDMADQPVSAQNAKACQTLCFNNKACLSWAFDTCGTRCWLKKGVAGFTLADNCRASGIIPNRGSPAPVPTKPTPTPTPTPTPVPTNNAGGKPTFIDDFNGALDTSKWYVSDYPPSELFASSWSKDQVRVANGKLDLVIDQQGCPGNCGGHKWRAGEIASNNKYTYGYLETTFIPACSTGGISSLFTYADASGGAEIDIEFEGGAKGCTGVSYTHYAGGQTFGWGVHDLGFNAKEKMHTYGFLWTPKKIDWYVDGRLHFSTATSGKSVSVPSAPMNLMINNWVVTKQDAYYGVFPTGKTVTASYDRVVYYPLNSLPSYVKA